MSTLTYQPNITMTFIHHEEFVPLYMLFVIFFTCVIGSVYTCEVEKQVEEIVRDDQEEEDQAEESEETDQAEDDVLRFETDDVKYDQAANILAYIYSRGLVLPGITFPLKSRSINDKFVKIKYNSFLKKVKKYKNNPTPSMQELIDQKATLDQLMEAYQYYSGITLSLDLEDDMDDNESVCSNLPN